MRVLLYLIVGVIALTLLRSVLEAIGKAFTASGTPAPRGRAPESEPVAQSLKKDPVCGTFVAAATAVQKIKGGETYYFCSTACRDKF